MHGGCVIKLDFYLCLNCRTDEKQKNCDYLACPNISHKRLDRDTEDKHACYDFLKIVGIYLTNSNLIGSAGVRAVLVPG